MKLNTKAELTNLDKIFWPVERYTKGDVLAYYDKIADYLLPYLKDRPQSLNRHPDGIKGESFYQKNVPNHPKWVKTVSIYSKSKKESIHWVICNDKDTLLYLVNLGCIELNTWNSRLKAKKHPDYLILDLDPEAVGFDKVVNTAKEIKVLLDELEIDGFVKTSGKTGLHILIPLGTKYTYKQTKQFAEILAKTVSERLPKITSITRDPELRQGKVYVDFLQNRYAQTLTPPYSLRPVAKAPVSTPLHWSELKSNLNPTDFNIKNIFRRVSQTGDLWSGLLNHPGIDMLSCLEKLTNS